MATAESDMGFMPLAIAEWLGHEKIETTLNTYWYLYPNKQGELAEQGKKRTVKVDGKQKIGSCFNDKKYLA